MPQKEEVPLKGTSENYQNILSKNVGSPCENKKILVLVQLSPSKLLHKISPIPIVKNQHSQVRESKMQQILLAHSLKKKKKKKAIKSKRNLIASFDNNLA